MNIKSLPQTSSTRSICANVNRYVKAMVTRPDRVVLARDTYLKLSTAAKGEALDFDGIPLVSK